jgi:arylsulfatase A-like enzyme
MKSGCHHPEGVLWVRTGRHAVHSERVSILDVAPTVCDLLRLDPDAVRCAGLRGVSLLDRVTLNGLVMAQAA